MPDNSDNNWARKYKRLEEPKKQVLEARKQGKIETVRTLEEHGIEEDTKILKQRRSSVLSKDNHCRRSRITVDKIKQSTKENNTRKEYSMQGTILDLLKGEQERETHNRRLS